MIKKYKNIAAFLVIAFCLVFPFALVKTQGGDYEMFPAAIFPGGSGRKHIGKEIALNSMELYGEKANSNGEFVELNKRSLLKKIYIHHIIYLVTRDYIGAIPYDENNPKKDNPYAAYATQEDIEQTKEWLRKGLSEQNCKDSVIVVKFTELKLDKTTRQLISNTVVDERVFKLY